jgi:ArsR family transcriptional regulator
MRAAQAYRALADPTRLRILRLLRGGALCVGDLVRALRIPQPTASRHLAYLQRAALVHHERRGPWSFYLLADPADEFHQRLLESVAALNLPGGRKDETALLALQRKGGCCPEHPRNGNET